MARLGLSFMRLVCGGRDIMEKLDFTTKEKAIIAMSADRKLTGKELKIDERRIKTVSVLW